VDHTVFPASRAGRSPGEGAVMTTTLDEMTLGQMIPTKKPDPTAEEWPRSSWSGWPRRRACRLLQGFGDLTCASSPTTSTSSRPWTLTPPATTNPRTPGCELSPKTRVNDVPRHHNARPKGFEPPTF